ncbi:lysophospholipid acyltransferase family protein [Magnetovibrio blakemorei]|uniref:Phospholipid/glycerol acyltransferase domain-containing protein n=1 Tax=Magnetovibrio blakemorei TaxID=28181 RepID=A0A1E5QC63_9PROT|nr:lysophospholipid acyltransferase family protein [Magnetovibrio blakemorei]OEJ69653.1 hypothetical protein BEN30_02110 [Magnetovibrio blakemorei]
MTFSVLRAGLNVFLFLVLIGLLLGPYVLMIALAPHKRHKIAQLFFKGCVALTGLRLVVTGAPSERTVMFASNHASYLDIIVLGAVIPGGVFVAKSEVADWPLFGFLARLSRTIFISRNGQDAALQRTVLAARMNKGHALVLFPEGTSTNGASIKRFKSTLFAALDDVNAQPWVQPVSLVYARHVNGPQLSPGPLLSQSEREQFTWFGDMTLAPHLLNVFGSRGCEVEVTFHQPLNAVQFDDRKMIAKACEEAVGGHLNDTLGPITLDLNVAANDTESFTSLGQTAPAIGAE